MRLLKNFIKSLLLFGIVLIVYGCSDSVAIFDENETVILFLDEESFNSLEWVLAGYSINQNQVRHLYHNKFFGISANLNPGQLSKIGEDFPPGSVSEIPGEFIIIFEDPFDGEKWVTEEGAEWSWKTIELLQQRHDISDSQITHRYGYATRGFAAELDDDQVSGLDNEAVIKSIVPNIGGFVIQ